VQRVATMPPAIKKALPWQRLFDRLLANYSHLSVLTTMTGVGTAAVASL